MSVTETEIANLALAHLGTGKQIAVLDTDRTEEARACRQFYAIARDATQLDFPWTFTRRFAELVQVEEEPTPEWAASYRSPSDSLVVRRILSGSRNDSQDSRVPFVETSDDAGGLIYTDWTEPVVEYSKQVTDTSKFTSDYVIALSFRLAAYIAPRLTAGDPFKLGPRALEMYAYEGSKAMKNAALRERPEQEVASSYERARE